MVFISCGRERNKITWCSFYAGSAAYAGGLRSNDRILEVNGQDARGASHAVVVDWVIAGGTKLTMKVLSVSDIEAARLKRLEDLLEDPDGKKAAKVTKENLQ